MEKHGTAKKLGLVQQVAINAIARKQYEFNVLEITLYYRDSHPSDRISVPTMENYLTELLAKGTIRTIGKNVMGMDIYKWNGN